MNIHLVQAKSEICQEFLNYGKITTGKATVCCGFPKKLPLRILLRVCQNSLTHFLICVIVVIAVEDTAFFCCGFFQKNQAGQHWQMHVRHMCEKTDFCCDRTQN